MKCGGSNAGSLSATPLFVFYPSKFFQAEILRTLAGNFLIAADTGAHEARCERYFSLIVIARQPKRSQIAQKIVMVYTI